MKFQNRSKMAMDRERWKRIVEEPKTHRGKETRSTLKHKNPHNILQKFNNMTTIFLCLCSCLVCLFSVLCVLCFCVVLCIASPSVSSCLFSMFA